MMTVAMVDMFSRQVPGGMVSISKEKAAQLLALLSKFAQTLSGSVADTLSNR